MPVHKDSHVYNMNHPKRGQAVIFNHEHFDSDLRLGRRYGTEKDRENLIAILTNMGFDVKCHDDLIRDDVVREIEELAKEDFSHHDCLLIAVLSHGDTNKMYAKDDAYKPDLLWMPFAADKVRTLAGKPKIFLVQACQGDLVDGGSTIVRPSTSRTEVDGGRLSRMPDPTQADASQGSFRIPNYADFLIVYSTFPGHFAWRSSKKGSWFIQAVCSVWAEYANQKDLLSMMTVVSREVALRFESNTPEMPGTHQKKQIPFLTSTLIRDVHLGPKITPQYSSALH